MRAIVLTSAIAVAIALFACRFSTDQSAFLPELRFPQIAVTDAGAHSAVHPSASESLILDLDQYDDPDYGFSMAIPAGWGRIVAADHSITDQEDGPAWSEPGYAVGFESPRSGSSDRFADYILIEVLPGDDTGLFSSAAEHRQILHLGDDQIVYDRLVINSESNNSIDVDLVIFQRGVQAVGYTLGFYAIGEPANEQALFDAFQIMLRTYTQRSAPFVII